MKNINDEVSPMPTADGDYFKAHQIYYWFDRLDKQVYSAQWIPCQTTPTGEVMIQGSKIPVRQLRSARSDAVEDGVTFYRQQIRELESAIFMLECQESKGIRP